VGIKLSAVTGGDNEVGKRFGRPTFKRDLDPKAITGNIRGTITVANYTFNQPGLREIIGPRIAIVHELAHAWDQRTGGFWAWLTNGPGTITAGMPSAIGNEDAPTGYGDSNILEDWAESVASYVYPEYAEILVAENPPRVQAGIQPGLDTRPNHYNYVACQFGISTSCNP